MRRELAEWERHPWRYAAAVGIVVGLIDGVAQRVGLHHSWETTIVAAVEGGSPWFLIWGLFGWWRLRRWRER